MLPAFSDEDLDTFVTAAWSAWQTMAEESGEEGERYYNTVTQALSDNQ
ncbi:hypothetical protein HORIV_67630 [Vreelandella olivaria]|nr:hypothetical protein HORIV_67630 [Halomonas olivaria]